MDDPKTPRHLRGLPQNVVDSLSAEERQAFADLRTEGDRAAWARQAAGWLPGPLADRVAAGELAERAARLYQDLDEKAPGGAFDRALAETLGRRRGMDARDTTDALHQLRRAELVADDGAGGFMLLPPSDVPF